jgi:uncharacterized protein (DUF849 family)
VRDDIPKVWIESALNGAWGRDRQPAIPISVEEIVADGVAAAKAGAAIIHLHAYDAVTGRQRDTYEIYAPIIETFVPKSMPSFIRPCRSRGPTMLANGSVPVSVTSMSSGSPRTACSNGQ